jgi:molybdate transport system substrate-binding protein
MHSLAISLLLSLGACGASPSGSVQVSIAVSSNFGPAQESLACAFEAGGGDELVASSGSTGRLYAQIVHGAPFDLFLAADELHPARLEEDGLAVAGTRFVYATGRLALWFPQAPPELEGPELVRRARRLAIADPETAPYGRAAEAWLRSTGLWEESSDRLVRGESVAQVFAFVSSGAVDGGLLALSSLIAAGIEPTWLVPASEHPPLDQVAVLLERGRRNPAAVAYLEFLRGPVARELLLAAG